MSTHECNVVKIDSVTDHPNADRLSLVRIGGYVAISNKLEDGTPRYKTGDLVVYIPSDMLLPANLLQEMDFWKDGKGTLSGSAGNRVKPMRLRQIFSEGILYPVEKLNFSWKLGDDVKENLGITVWEPTVPVSMRGHCQALPRQPNDNQGRTPVVKFDIENIKGNMKLFEENENVVITEKLHGTLCRFTSLADSTDITDDFKIEGKVLFASSKGLGNKGIVFKNNEENLHTNIYVKTLFKLYDNVNKLVTEVRKHHEQTDDVTVFGEIIGPGVQEGFHYGLKEPTLYLFGIYVNSKPLSLLSVKSYAEMFKFNYAPVLYVGPYSYEKALELANGPEVIAGKHINEGVVITPTTERYVERFGRVILKLIGEKYLLRKGGTEYQ